MSRLGIAQYFPTGTPTLITSDGPDKLRNSFYPGHLHHIDLARSGYQDYNTCCNPCLYRNYYDSVLSYKSTCCKCYPRFLVFNFTPSDDNECCQAEATWGFASVSDDTDNEVTVITYQATLAGNDISVNIDPYPTGNVFGGYAGQSGVRGCYWHWSSNSLGVSGQEVIDHTGVTCLGVPDISIGNIVAFDNCTGTISVSDYDMYKIPFTHRFWDGSDGDHDNIIGYSQGFPVTGDIGTQTIGYLDTTQSPAKYETTGVYIGDIPRGSCANVPRFLCVQGDRLPGGGVDPEPYAEYEIDYDYMGYDVSGNNYNSVLDFRSHLVYESGIEIARWKYTPTDTGTYPYEYLYLIEMQDKENVYGYSYDYNDDLNAYSGEIGENITYSYEFRLDSDRSLLNLGYPRLNTDAPAENLFWDSNGEFWGEFDYNRLTFNNNYAKATYPTWGYRDLYGDGTDEICSCSFTKKRWGKAISSQPGDSYSLDIKSGRCSSWRYRCGTARCAPTNICGVIIESSGEDNITLADFSLAWDSGLYAWTDGADITMTLGDESRLEKSCQMSLEMNNGFSFGTSDLTGGECSNGNSQCPDISPFVGGYFSDFSNPDPSIWAEVVIYPNIGGTPCSTILPCTYATPCADNCGSHPDTLSATFVCTQDEAVASGYGNCDPEPGVFDGADGPCASVTVTLDYRQTISYLGETSFESDCYYEGLYYLECYDDISNTNIGYLYKVTLGGIGNEDQITVEKYESLPYPTGSLLNSTTIDLYNSVGGRPDCDPYYGSGIECIDVAGGECIIGCFDAYGCSVEVTE